MKASKINPLKVLLVFLFSGFSDNAYAWGHAKNLDTEWGQASLSYAAVNRHQINYCVEIDPRNQQEFSEKSIGSQTEMALSLWLKPVSSVINHAVTIHRVDCSSDTIDLQINLGPNILSGKRDTSSVGEAGYSMRGKKPHTIINLDTVKIYNFNQIVDNIGPQKVSLQAAMESANSMKKEARNIGIEANVNDDVVAYSTYPTILHELGHGFGLCDTAEEMVARECDANHSTSTQPNSVMKVLNYLYLTSDDQAGVSELAQRFSSFKSQHVDAKY